MKHTEGPLPKIGPYVTAKGGVVILNGPFPLDQAKRIKVLCEAAPAMLEALKAFAKWETTTRRIFQACHAVITLAESEG